MKLVRSWPAEIPEGRGYVMDDIERLVMDGYDYRCLADVGDDVVLIEWDIAVGGEDLELFMARCAENPAQVRVAPYLLYPASTRAKKPFYVHRYREGGRNVYVTGPEYDICHQFGFGLVYIPRNLILKFVEHLNAQPMHRKFSDTTFSYWHFRNAPRENRRVPIDWDVKLVHLHYDMPEVPDVR